MLEQLWMQLLLWRLRRQLDRAHALTDRVLLRQRTEQMREVICEARAVGLA